ncbi:MAG: VapC toxin family PIN domain ribonuclease [Acidobacteria bacterium]|nr:MAG: VapC toxin family PIN domain ribonuclease [Acidobacteriota bacterium]
MWKNRKDLRDVPGYVRKLRLGRWVIFDTDVLIWSFRGDQKAVAMIGSQADREASIISLMELLQGARSRLEMKNIRGFLQDADILPVNESISHLAATLMEEHALTGLQVADALIAATAWEVNRPLATGNVLPYRPILGIELKSFRPGKVRD